MLTLEKEKKNQALINNKYIPVNILVEKFGEEFHSKGLHISKHTFAFPEKFFASGYVSRSHFQSIMACIIYNHNLTTFDITLTLI